MVSQLGRPIPLQAQKDNKKKTARFVSIVAVYCLGKLVAKSTSHVHHRPAATARASGERERGDTNRCMHASPFDHSSLPHSSPPTAPSPHIISTVRGMRSIEGLFNDSHWEIRIPNARIDSLEDDYKSVIQAKPRTHVFYGTAPTLHPDPIALALRSMTVCMS